MSARGPGSVARRHCGIARKLAPPGRSTALGVHVQLSRRVGRHAPKGRKTDMHTAWRVQWPTVQGPHASAAPQVGPWLAFMHACRRRWTPLHYSHFQLAVVLSIAMSVMVMAAASPLSGSMRLRVTFVARRGRLPVRNSYGKGHVVGARERGSGACTAGAGSRVGLKHGA